MFNLTTNKIIGIVGCVTGVSATGAGIVYLTSDSNKSEEAASSQSKQLDTKNKVNHKLTEVGYLPFKTDGSELGTTWAEMLIQYKKIKVTETDLEDIKDEQALKNKCSLALNSQKTESSSYSFAKRFCVKAETIKEMLKRNGYTKLDKKISPENKAKWQTILDLIKENTKAKTDIKLTLNGAEDGYLQLLADACKNFETENSKTYQDKDFEKHYSEVKEWCSSKDHD